MIYLYAFGAMLILTTQNVLPMFKFDDLENTIESSLSSDECPWENFSSDNENVVIDSDQRKTGYSLIFNEEQFEKLTPFQQSLPMRKYPFFWNFIHKQSDTDLNIVDHNGNTVLILLCQSYTDLLEANNSESESPDKITHQQKVMCLFFDLLARNPAINVTNNFGVTALSHAAKYGHYDLVEALIQHGAHVDTPDNRGFSPLMYATMFQHSQIVRLLVKENALINAPNSFGYTAMYYAQHVRAREIAGFLEDNGANTLKSDRED